MLHRAFCGVASACCILIASQAVKAQDEPRDPSAGEIVATYYAGTADIKGRLDDMALAAYNAAIWSNGYVEKVMHQKPMFCIPDGTFLDGSGLFAMIRNMIGDDPKFAQAQFELTIVAGLIQRYPCRS